MLLLAVLRLKKENKTEKRKKAILLCSQLLNTDIWMMESVGVIKCCLRLVLFCACIANKLNHLIQIYS